MINNLNMKRKTYKSHQKQGGTLYIKRTPTDKINNSIYQILKYATHMEVFGVNSLYGLNLKITIPAEKSRLIGSSMRDLGTPKTQFLIKLLITFNVNRAYRDTRYERYKQIYWNYRNHATENNTKAATFIDDFNKEVQLQQDIFVKSSYLGNPICPAIITAGTFEHSTRVPVNESYSKLHRELVKMSERLNNQEFLEILRKINIAVTTPRLYANQNETIRPWFPLENISLGIICMELLEGSQTMYQYLYSPDNPDNRPPINVVDEIYGKTIYELMRLVNIGYFHGDLHLNNVMYNPAYDKIIFIDFGRTKRIREERNAQGTYTYRYFNTRLNDIQYANVRYDNEDDKRNYLKLLGEQLIRAYDYRTKEPTYVRENRVMPENLFIDINHFRIMRDMGQIMTHFANRYIERERAIHQLVQTGELNHLIHMKSLKTDVFDVYGRLRGLKFKDTNENIEMDMEILMFLREYQNKRDVVNSRRVGLKKINNSKLPRFYTQRLAPIIRQERRRQTRRLRPRR
jgi:hypothetical protein